MSKYGYTNNRVSIFVKMADMLNIREKCHIMYKTEEIMKKTQKIIIGIAVILVIFVSSLLFFYFNGQKAVSSKSEEVVVEISGSTNTVLNQLDAAGLIKNKVVANIYAKLNHFDFKANVYVLNKNMDLKTIFEILEGDKKYISTAKITILDGQTIPECAQQVAKALEIEIDTNGLNDKQILEAKTQKVLEKWTNKEYLQTLVDKYWFLDQNILGTEIMFPLEGYFGPETYVITSKKTTIENVTEMMLEQMDKNLSAIKDKITTFKINGNNVTIHQFLSLASVVQCEASGQKDDQTKIAGVFIHRLEIPMRLQSDVTVNYANQVKTVAVTYNHLEVDSKYNTYKYEGLPIGPISMVSNDIMLSCLNYQTTDDLFFFALADGTVIYSKTYDEHQKVVKENKWY